MSTQGKNTMVFEETNELYPIESYLMRIGFRGELDASFKTLSLLHRLHVATIPFENLDVLLGEVISFDGDVLWEKMIMNRRGGYCFEQNSLFKAVLEHVGFKVTAMLARVRWQVPDEVSTPLSHMVLKVECAEGAYLADVGFGGVGLVEPIELSFGRVQHEQYEPRRIIEDGRFCVHQILLKGNWQDVYRFEDKAAPRIDLEVGNWFSCTHPKARFKRELMATLVDETRRTYINNTTFVIRPHGGEPISREIETYVELLAVLREAFGLNFPEGTRFECPGLTLGD